MSGPTRNVRLLISNLLDYAIIAGRASLWAVQLLLQR
jgi:hypothetical protein